MALVKINTDVVLARGCHPICCSLATLGVAKIQSLYFDPSSLFDDLASKNGICTVITSGTILSKVGPGNLRIFCFQCLQHMLLLQDHSGTPLATRLNSMNERLRLNFTSSPPENNSDVPRDSPLSESILLGFSIRLGKEH